MGNKKELKSLTSAYLEGLLFAIEIEENIVDRVILESMFIRRASVLESHGYNIDFFWEEYGAIVENKYEKGEDFYLDIKFREKLK